jgi:hypothetical protein
VPAPAPVRRVLVEDANASVIGLGEVGAENPLVDGLCERMEFFPDLVPPPVDRTLGQVHPQAPVDAKGAMDGRMVNRLADHNVCEQAGSGNSPVKWLHHCGGRDDTRGRTSLARELFARVHDDLEARWDEFENLAGFMPNADLARATDRADSQFRFYRNLYLSARKTRRKSHPLGFGLWPRLSFRVRGRFSFRIPLGGDGFLQGFFPKLQLGAPELLRSALRAPAQHRLELSREHRLVPHQSGNEREDEIDRLLHSFGRPHPHEEVTKDAEVLGTGLRLGMGKKLRHTPRSHDPTGETTGLLSDFCQLL